MNICPCGSLKPFDSCCGLFIFHQEIPTSAEQLMRSRYSAYVLNHMEYIENTMTGLALIGFVKEEARKWSSSIKWLGLNVLKHCQIDLAHAEVEFIIAYQQKEKIIQVREKSQFIMQDGRWLYLDGQLSPPQVRRLSANQPCYCQSGKKYKNCHFNRT